tara:strand:+ start:500 stop:1765 length:1266 start_codon:yes stop_codon:yes gene_type:complete
MTTLIELHDHNVRISSPQGLLGESPGYASTAEKTPVFGTQALGLTRLHPQQNFNQFWFQLSLDPLINKNKYFRHQADLAYGHLESISGQFGLSGDTVFAVPSHYTASQLATLLGLVKHCSIDAAGLVDMSLLALANLHEHQHALFMDIQLHQTVLTLVSREGGEIKREKVLPIPGTGLMALYDTWANTITDAFIKQSRFDPLHNADTEQYIYNELQSWLQAVNLNQEILLEINNKGAIHQASLTLKNFAARAQTIFNRVRQELDSIATNSTPVYVLERALHLPGLQQTLPDIVAVADDVITGNGFQHLALIKSTGDSLKLINRLPAAQSNMLTKSKAPDFSRPSHFLYKHKAYAMADINLPELKLAAPIKITLQDQGYCLHNDPELDLQLNGSPLTESSILKLGDCLTVNKHSLFEFIQVQ